MRNIFHHMLLRSDPRLFIFLFFITWNLGCNEQTDIKKNNLDPKRPPILVIIGADVSKTFKGYDKMQSEHIRQICDVVLNAGGGGLIVFQTIGNPTNQSFLRCEINPIQSTNCDDESLTETEQINCKSVKISQKKKQKNIIDNFILNCSKALEQPLHNETDINGFFRKSSTLVNGPTVVDSKKYVYIHSDGLHDVKGNKELDCSIMPLVDVFCVSGWDAPSKCEFTYYLNSPDEFVTLLKNELPEQ